MPKSGEGTDTHEVTALDTGDEVRELQGDTGGWMTFGSFATDVPDEHVRDDPVDRWEQGVWEARIIKVM